MCRVCWRRLNGARSLNASGIGVWHGGGLSRAAALSASSSSTRRLCSTTWCGRCGRWGGKGLGVKLREGAQLLVHHRLEALRGGARDVGEAEGVGDGSDLDGREAVGPHRHEGAWWHLTHLLGLLQHNLELSTMRQPLD